ncbi:MULTISPECIES: hypothetical protein [Bacillus]|uniref:hypothetical protein n=1 Tax=Bacillus TaxID=1386 RepID=UPI0002EE01CF|nr:MULTISPECIES: hypothetical protein [Bacillus]
MKKISCIMGACIISILMLSGCINTKLDINNLSRVDVEKASSDSPDNNETISEEEDLKVLRKAFKAINKENAKIKMSREEDVKVSLFFEYDKNNPEIIVEYLIWFESNGTAKIIEKDKNIYGKLDKENAQVIKDILLENK